MKTVLNENRLGRYLKTLRQDMGISQYRLAALTGLSVSHICRLEKGNRLPSGKMIVALAGTLGVAEKELLAMAGYIAPTTTPGKAESTTPAAARIDPVVAAALGRLEPRVQRDIIEILRTLKKTAGTMASSR